MEYQSNPYDMGNFNPMGTQEIPNSTVILVLGILSIPLCCFCGIGGLTVGIIALVLSTKSKEIYDMNPSAYSPGSYTNMNAGRICAIVGIVLSAMYTLYNIFILAIYGFAALAHPSFMN